MASVAGDFLGISLVFLGSAQRIVAEILDKDGVYSTDKDSGVRKP